MGEGLLSFTCPPTGKETSPKHKYLFSHSSTVAHQSSSSFFHIVQGSNLESHTGASEPPPPGIYQEELQLEGHLTVVETTEKNEKFEVSAEESSRNAAQ